MKMWDAEVKVHHAGNQQMVWLVVMTLLDMKVNAGECNL